MNTALGYPLAQNWHFELAGVFGVFSFPLSAVILHVLSGACTDWQREAGVTIRWLRFAEMATKTKEDRRLSKRGVPLLSQDIFHEDWNRNGSSSALFAVTPTRDEEKGFAHQETPSSAVIGHAAKIIEGALRVPACPSCFLWLKPLYSLLRACVCCRRACGP